MRLNFSKNQLQQHFCKRLSSYPIKSLALTLREHARHLRRYLILDSCFAAAAYEAFMSPPLEVACQKTLEEFPRRGTALLCASGPRDPARILPTQQSTVFSDALLYVLRQGSPEEPEKLSLAQLGGLIRDQIKERNLTDAVRPEVHSPDQKEGDVATLPLFPNLAIKQGPVIKESRLFVETVPQDAMVRILNLAVNFEQGMVLEPGNYQLEVSAVGYETKKEWIKLDVGEVEHIVVELKKIDGLLSKELIFWSLWVLAISIGWFASWSLNHYVIIPAVKGKRGDAQIVGIITGVIIGLSQWIVLRRQKIQVIPWVLAIWWVGATIAGITINCSFDVALPDSIFYYWALWGAILGIFQVFVFCFILKFEISRAAWWVLISALGTALGSLWYGKSPLWPFNNLLVGTVYGAITGFGLVWLLRQRNHGN